MIRGVWKKHKYLFPIVFLLASIIGELFFLAGQNKAYTIELREDGFYPKEFTIKKGDTITFTSSRQKPFWPASNLHPTHEIYPEFDPKHPIELGESWSFRFEKEGEWRYHDHLFPNYAGSIVVRGTSFAKGSAALASLSDCENVTTMGEKQKCWDNLLASTLKEKGLKEAFDVFAKLYRTDPEIPKACHGWSHVLGEGAFDLFMKKGSLAFTLPKETAYCGYGFYHGFMEKLFLENGGDTKKALEFCLNASRQGLDGGIYFNCLHGIGHGSAAIVTEEPSLLGNFQAMVDRGLKTCESILHKEGELQVCYEGAFNEMQQNINSREFGLSKELIKDDFFWICRKQEERYKSACYYEFVGLIAEFTNRNFAKAATMIIEDVFHPSSLAHAMRKLAADFMQDDIVKTDWSENVAGCRRLPESLHIPCFEGVIIGFIAHGEPEKEYVKGLAFCQSPVLIDKERTMCYQNMIGQFRSMYPRQKMNQICQGVQEQYQANCLSR